MATEEELNDFLQHFGVKGMHWGVRSARSAEEEGRGSHAARVAAHRQKKVAHLQERSKNLETGIHNIKSHIKDAEENGTRAELFQERYGHRVVGNEGLFQTLNGQSRASALAEHKSSLQQDLADHQDYLERTNRHIARLQKKG